MKNYWDVKSGETTHRVRKGHALKAWPIKALSGKRVLIFIDLDERADHEQLVGYTLTPAQARDLAGALTRLARDCEARS